MIYDKHHAKFVINRLLDEPNVWSDAAAETCNEYWGDLNSAHSAKKIFLRPPPKLEFWGGRTIQH